MASACLITLLHLNPQFYVTIALFIPNILRAQFYLDVSPLAMGTGRSESGKVLAARNRLFTRRIFGTIGEGPGPLYW